jgi:hypothetical protein
MNIIFDSPQVELLRKRHLVLELDRFLLPNQTEPIKSYCVVEQIPITEINTADQYAKLHVELLEHFQKQNWKVCLDAIQLLLGRWGGELDSFYHNLYQRIVELQDQQLPETWTGIIDKTLPTT